jgi:hypothetical protein
MIGNFARRTPLGYREVREDKLVELGFSQLYGDGRAVGIFGGDAHQVRISCKEGCLAQDNQNLSKNYNSLGQFCKTRKQFSNKEVATAVALSVRTVETHRANIMRKLELTSIVGLVHYAVRHQLIHP